MDGPPSDRKIVKLCEYASRNPVRIPKIAKYLEERCYKELRSGHIKLALAGGVIPNEYGINPKQKLKIGSKIARRLLGKILIDLRNRTREEALSVAELKSNQDLDSSTLKTGLDDAVSNSKLLDNNDEPRRSNTFIDISLDQDDDEDKETKYHLDP
ncbi:hypothetical protein K1719_043930 [Acacia pycnantha]|nr:hypothetical protein K1719_043930 [Acacia pycnantha]